MGRKVRVYFWPCVRSGAFRHLIRTNIYLKNQTMKSLAKQLPLLGGVRFLMYLMSLICLISGNALAQDCSTEKAHEFDFWIGEWDVTAGGNVAGTNSIQPILNGCVLQETWAGAGGSAGSSFTYYEPQKEQWEQFWVWRNGTTLYTKGHYADGKMTLQGESLNRNGESVTNRITWRNNEDGTVRQHWEVSKNGGETWSTSFDGVYRLRGEE